MESSSLGQPAADESGPAVTEPTAGSSASEAGSSPTQVADAPLPPPSPSLAVRQACRRALRQGKYLIGDNPVFLPVLLRATPEGTSRAITPRTQLVVEGF